MISKFQLFEEKDLTAKIIDRQTDRLLMLVWNRYLTFLAVNDKVSFLIP